MDLELLKDYRLHDTRIIGYQKRDNDVILEFVESDICRITFKNVRINEDIEIRLAFDLINAIEYIDEAIIEISGAKYGVNNDGNYYFSASLVRIPENCFDYKNLKVIESGYRTYKEHPMISFIADKVEIERLPFSLLRKKYVRTTNDYQNNLLKYVGKLDNDVYNLFSLNNNIFVPIIIELNDDLVINFVSEDEKYNFVLRLVDAEILLMENDIDECFILNKIKRYFYSSLYFRIINWINNCYEVGFFISDVREVIVKCKDIKIDR